MPDKSNSDTFTGMETTRTMRAKAKFVGRCFITMLKCFRMCKKTPKDKERAQKDIL